MGRTNDYDIMAYPIKNTTTTQLNSLLKLNFAIGVNQGGYGPTSSTAFWNGKTPNVSGYVTYVGNGTSSPTMYVSTDDTQLIALANQLGGGGGITTIGDAVSYLNFLGGNYMCVNMDCPNIVTSGLTLYLDAGYTPSYPKSTTVWKDLSGGGNTGTLTNGPIFSGENAGSIVFDGVDDRVIINDFNYGRSGCTVAAWVKYNASVGGYKEGIVSKWQTGAGTSNEFILTSNDLGQNSPKYAGFTIFNTNNQTVTATDTSTIMVVGTWYYVLGTFDGLNTRIYLNGEYKNISTTSTSPTIKTITAQSIALASFGSSFQYNTNCSIISAQIYNRPLSASEILQNYYAGKKRFIPTNGLVMWLDGENTNTRVITPTTAYDVSNNNYNGTLINGTSLSHRDAGTSFYFDGTNDYINCGNIMPLGNYTKVIIFKVPNFSYSDNLMSGNGQYLYLAGTPYLRTGHYVSGGEAISSYQTLVNTWNFAVVTFSTTSGFNIYQNGNTSVGSNPSTVAVSAIDLTLGTVGGSFLLQGQIGIAMLYSRVLTSTEILDIYTAYKGRFGYV